MNKFMWGDESYNDVFEGKQKDITHKKYVLDNMTGIIDIGKRRERQEDGILLMEKNGVKLMAVADGMGGMENGGICSNYALLTIALWFNKKNMSVDMNEKQLLLELKELIKAIGNKINYAYFGGTTLVLSIVLKNNTVTINVGDSRIYIYNNNELIQTSTDQSYAWEEYLKEGIPTKDNIRFFKYNNVIDCYLGGRLQDDDKIISNSEYEHILLLTDGITDLISDDEMLRKIKNNPYGYEEDILEYCLTTVNYNIMLDRYSFNNKTLPGKDNATIAVYRKK